MQCLLTIKKTLNYYRRPRKKKSSLTGCFIFVSWDHQIGIQAYMCSYTWKIQKQPPEHRGTAEMTGRDFHLSCAVITACQMFDTPAFRSHKSTRRLTIDNAYVINWNKLRCLLLVNTIAELQRFWKSKSRTTMHLFVNLWYQNGKRFGWSAVTENWLWIFICHRRPCCLL